MNPPIPRPPSTPSELDPHPPVRGESTLRALERLASRVVEVPRRFLEDRDNPFLNLGALANLTLMVAMVTGVLLLFWYTPSHEGAYASVEAMADSPLTAGLLRSLHRYSSDAALLFVLLHGMQVFIQRRLAGPRWLAWVSGIAAVFFIWLIGWLGYWLVWDERAQALAVGTAKLMDVLPIFTDPLERTFLTDASVSSLLFFVVFFVHMLLPMLMGIALWLHLARLSRPRWLPSRALALTSVAAMIALSFIAPATSSSAAAMASHPTPDTIDAWYLLPLLLTDRLSGGLLWLVFVVSSLVLYGIPWWMVKRRKLPLAALVAPPPPPQSGPQSGPQSAPHSSPADPNEAPHTIDNDASACAPASPTHLDSPPPASPNLSLARAPTAIVDPAKCNACETCYRDCPFDAIRMVPRSDGRNFPSVAWVDDSRCIGCGICVGSCDSSGVGPSWLTQPNERRRLDAWLAADRQNETTIIFVCARSGGSRIPFDPESGLSVAYPSSRIIAVPCSAWVHPLTVERALRRGARDVVVVSCRTGGCVNREGAEWTRDRLAATREPMLRFDHADISKIKLIEADPHELPDWSSTPALSAPHAPEPPITAPRARHRRLTRSLFIAALAFTFAALTWLPSELPYPAPDAGAPELVISFKLAGDSAQVCRTRSPEELASLPAHKRTPEVCERSRGAVRLVVDVDGTRVKDERYEPSGAFADGASTAIARVPVGPGEHSVIVRLGPEAPPASLEYVTERRERFAAGRRTVVVFDRLGGFVWH